MYRPRVFHKTMPTLYCLSSNQEHTFKKTNLRLKPVQGVKNVFPQTPKERNHAI